MLRNGTIKRHYGFTLIETLVTVAILSILVSGYASFKLEADISELNQKLSDALVEELTLIGNQAQTVYAQIGSWPDYTNQCMSALTDTTMRELSLDQNAPFPAVRYATSCSDKLFTISLEMPASLETWAYYIVARTPSIDSPSPLANGNQRLTSNWLLPADITVFKQLLSDYYKLDGSQAMTGDMDLGGHNIVDINRAQGNDFELSRKHSLSKTVENIRLVRAGDTIIKPDCNAPKIYITSANIGTPSGRPVTSIQWTASTTARVWTIENTLSDDRSFNTNDKSFLRGIALVKCS